MAVDAVTAEASHATWACGDSVDTIFVDGVERPVTQMPYPIYSEPMEQLVGLIGELGLVVPSTGWLAMVWTATGPVLGDRAHRNSPGVQLWGSSVFVKQQFQRC